jgi:NAD(P)-dependent dehydrogenase (short-subunit alcohol dehydrogenase family)
MKESDFSITGIGCDVSSELSVQQAFRRVMDTYGRIDSVVASAGTS